MIQSETKWKKSVIQITYKHEYFHFDVLDAERSITVIMMILTVTIHPAQDERYTKHYVKLK